MKKKTGATARKAAKHRKNEAGKRKAALLRARPAKAPQPQPRLPVAPSDAKLTIRRLRG